MLVAKKQEIDLGTLPFGKPHSFNFEVTNTGKEDITITKVVLGCSACTQADIENHFLKPKDSTNVKVIFTPGSTGINNKSISLGYGSTVLKLKFKAIVNK